MATHIMAAVFCAEVVDLLDEQRPANAAGGAHRHPPSCQVRRRHARVPPRLVCRRRSSGACPETAARCRRGGRRRAPPCAPARPASARSSSVARVPGALHASRLTGSTVRWPWFDERSHVIRARCCSRAATR